MIKDTFANYKLPTGHFAVRFNPDADAHKVAKKQEQLGKLLKKGFTMVNGLDDGTLIYKSTKAKEVSASPQHQALEVAQQEILAVATPKLSTRRKMNNIVTRVVQHQFSLAINMAAAGREGPRATVLAETDNFEKVHEDAEFEYGLKLVFTKRPRKVDPAPTPQAQPVAAVAPAVPVHPGFTPPVPFRAKRNKPAA